MSFMYCSLFCHEQGQIPTTEQHLDITGYSTAPCLQQSMCYSQSKMLRYSLIFPILTDVQCLYDSNNTVERERERVAATWMRANERRVLVQSPIGFPVLRLTMMLLHVRAEECCLWWFEVSFQVKMILLCIQILPNAFKNEKKRKKKKRPRCL